MKSKKGLKAFEAYVQNRLIAKHIKEIKYCSYCGHEIKPIFVGAETEYYFYDCDATIPYGDAYNQETGQRQYVAKYICPKFSKWFDTKHDSYSIDKIIHL